MAETEEKIDFAIAPDPALVLVLVLESAVVATIIAVQDKNETMKTHENVTENRAGVHEEMLLQALVILMIVLLRSTHLPLHREHLVTLIDDQKQIPPIDNRAV